jgi:hypothetical protein
MGEVIGGDAISGSVIRFPVELTGRRDRTGNMKEGQAAATAAILFFTGVRYSRLEDSGGGGRNADGEAGRRRRRRRNKA